MSVWGPSFFYRLVQAALFRTAFWARGVEWSGLEHVPSQGRLLIAVNHRSWVDPLLAAMVVYRVRCPRFLGKEELFRNPIAAWFLRTAGVVPLSRKRGDVGALRSAVDILKKEGCMVLFPEGTRSRTGSPSRPMPGIGFLAHHAGAPVVPARVWNTERFLSREPLRIRFGRSSRYEGPEDREAYQAFAERVMEAVFRLEVPTSCEK